MDSPSAAASSASHPSTRTVVVVTGGGPLSHRAADALGELVADQAVRLVAADSGLDHARAIGLTPDLLVGDLDSISAEGRGWAVERGLPTRCFPADKDATDTELAIRAAAGLDGGRAHLVLAAGSGDRLDHTLGTLGVLGGEASSTFETVDAWVGTSQVKIVRAARAVTLEQPPGTLFSVLALHGEVGGLTIAGARWPLDGVDLPAGSSRGLSNLFVDRLVTISVTSGTLTVVLP